MSEARVLLGRVLTASVGIDLTDRTFATWLLGMGSCPFDIQTLTTECITQRDRGYRNVAALGYAAEYSSPACGFRTELAEALRWVSSRPTTMCGEVAGFVTDPVALLGIALGASRSGQPEVEAAVVVWFEKVLTTRGPLPAFEPWEQMLLAAAAYRLNRPNLAAAPGCAETADCRIALRARAASPQAHPAEAITDETSLVALLVDAELSAIGFPRAALRAAAYDVLKGETLAAGTIGTTTPRSATMTAAHTDERGKKIFMSYAWESNDLEHQPRVLKLANQLRQYGFHTIMDLFDPNPPQGLPQWMLENILHSDFVIMVITETYRKRCEGEEATGKGKGVKWEGGIVTRQLYQAEFTNRKFIPVVFGSKHVSAIPAILVGNTYYDVSKPEGLEDLVRFLSDQPAHIPAPVGAVPRLPPRSDGSVS